MQAKATTTLRDILLSIYPAAKVIAPNVPLQDVEKLTQTHGAITQYAPPELSERVNAVMSDFRVDLGFYAHKSDTDNALTVLDEHIALFYDYVGTISPRTPSPIIAGSVNTLQERQATPNVAAAFVTFRLRITS